LSADQTLQSVVVSKQDDHWISLHVPSGKKAQGISPEDALNAMKILLGFEGDSAPTAPLTSPQFEGIGRAVALFLEGPISTSLSFHAGWARLTKFQSSVATVRLGGGCKGCPSSQITLFQGVKTQLQSRFGEEQVMEVELAQIDE
jgi:Fe-S cluster biogenesis protein NfuA